MQEDTMTENQQNWVREELARMEKTLEGQAKVSTAEQNQWIREEFRAIENRFDEKINKLVPTRLSKLMQGLLIGGILAMFGYLILFGVWTVNRIHDTDLKIKDLDTRDAVVQGWIDQGPRFTTKDAETLKYQILTEASDRVDRKLVLLSDKLDTLNKQIVQNHTETMQSRIEVQELKTLLYKSQVIPSSK